MSHTNECICGDGRWRFETADLQTGVLKGVLHPISADWEEKHSAYGQGSLTLATRDVTPDEIWPHDTSLYISQVIDGKRVGRWAGMFEAYDASSGGAATVGLQGIDEYLWHRTFANNTGGTGFSKTNTQQTEIAKAMVEAAVTVEGIPLKPIAQPSKFGRDKNENFWEYKNIGEAIQQFTEIINGPKYRLEHVYVEGRWSTNIRFMDAIGEDRGVILRGDIEGATYGINVSAKDHATWVYALGEGSEADQLTAIAYDSANKYPRFHAVPSFPSVSIQKTLNDHASGYIVDHRDPLATPSMTIPGLHPEPENLQLGDRVKVEFDYGLAKFNGYANIISIGWSLQDGSPVMRTLTFLPETRSNTSVRGETVSTSPASTGGVPTTSGAVSNLQDPRITDSAGMTHSKSF